MLYNGTLSNFAMVGYTADSALAVSTDGIVVCTSKNCIWYKCDEETCVPINTHTSDLGPILAMAVQSDNSVWVGGKNSGLLHLSATGTIINVVKVIGNITAIAVGTTDVAVGTTDAVYYQFDPTQKMFTKWVQANGASMDGHPTALAFLKEELWIGGEWCLNVVRKDGFTVDRVAGYQGLPVGNITSLDTDDAGSLWIGTEQGLAMMSPMSSVPEKWRYFGGDRWIPGSNNITSLSMPWVATKFGIAKIDSIPMTMSTKAEYYTNVTSILSRHGWIASVGLSKYGDASSIVKHDGDNDGLWTGMLVSGLIFQYAKTKSETAKRLAWKHYAAVEFLHNVTNTKGFIARSAVKCGEPHGGGDGGICPQGSPNSCGWVNSSVCYNGVDDVNSDATCCWQWKRDTSSDEVTGHFFTMLQAWTFLAENQSEKDRVQNSMCNTADYLIKGNLKFIDPVSGAGTR